MNRRLGWWWTCSAVLAATVYLSAQGRVQTAVETVPVQGQVHLIAGAGGNVTALVGEQGVLLVDTGNEAMSGQVLAAVRALTPRPIHFIFNTSADLDHVGGNEVIAKAGRPAPGSNQAGTGVAPIYAHETVLNRLIGERPALAPTVSFFTDKRTHVFNGEPIELLWQRAAHTDGDIFVFFRRSDVLSVGDVLRTDMFPVIDRAKGGSVQGEIAALNRIIDITIPRMNQTDGTRVVPGHGRLCNEADVVEYRDMVTIIRDRVQTLREQGQSLAQVQAARPAYEYEPLYGADRGAWTTAMFVEAVYQSLDVR